MAKHVHVHLPRPRLFGRSDATLRDVTAAQLIPEPASTGQSAADLFVQLGRLIRDAGVAYADSFKSTSLSQDASVALAQAIPVLLVAGLLLGQTQRLYTRHRGVAALYTVSVTMVVTGTIIAVIGAGRPDGIPPGGWATVVWIALYGSATFVVLAAAVAVGLIPIRGKSTS